MLDDKDIPALDATSEDEPVDTAPPTEDAKPKADEDTPEAKSPYQEELERIEAEKEAIRGQLEEEKAEKARLMELKDKAIKAEKDKTKDVKTSLKEEIMQEWRQELALKEAKKAISSITDDPVAQKVTLHHFERLPESLKTGDVEEDLLTAYALANRKRIASLTSAQSAEDMGTQRSISSLGNGSSGRSSFQTSPSAAARLAESLARAYAGKDKDLAKRLSERNASHLASKSGRLR